MFQLPASSTAPDSRHSRREFVASLVPRIAAGLYGLELVKSSASSASAGNTQTLVGSNIYGWGQYAQREHRTLDVQDVISALRDTGYDYLENFLDVAHPEENAIFAGQLRAKGLQPVSLYAGARLHEADKASAVVSQLLEAGKVCQKAGFKVISCNADPIGREKTQQELETQAKALTELGQGLNNLGLRLGVHQHLPEMANGAREFHYDFDHTRANVVGWCYDVHWVWKGGIQPVVALRQYGERVVTWHLRQSRQGIWWEDLDTGDVDYSAVAKYAWAHRLSRHFTVELALEGGTKVTRSVVENHRRSREFVRRVFETNV